MTWPPYGSKEPLYVHDRRPILVRPELGNAAYSVQEDIDGGLVVIDNDTMLIMGVFRADMREFAEDMRDRLIIRRLARIAAERRCPKCGRPAIAYRKPRHGSAMWTHEDGAEHEGLLAEMGKS